MFDKSKRTVGKKEILLIIMCILINICAGCADESVSTQFDKAINSVEVEKNETIGEESDMTATIDGDETTAGDGIIDEIEETEAYKDDTNMSIPEKDASLRVIKVCECYMDNDDAAAALMANGDVYCWGYNKRGQVGDGTREDRYEPVKILENVIDISVGGDHSAAITKNGDLYCWGDNSYGQIGCDTAENYQSTPLKVLENVEAVSLGWQHSAAVTSNGDLYCWGDNEAGEVGNGTTIVQRIPAKIMENVKSVYLNQSTRVSAAITKNGDLYCWGDNSVGQIGCGENGMQLLPIKVLENVKSVSLGSDHSAAITTNNDLYCWGDNILGAVGNGTTEDQLEPKQILEKIESVSLGLWRGMAVMTNGELYCWGGFQRSLDSKEDAWIPRKVLFSESYETDGSDSIDSGVQEKDDDNYAGNVLPYSDSVYYDSSDLDNFSDEECRIARNEIYARHGRRFNDEYLQHYFDTCSWYEGTIDPEDFSDEVLNEVEKANLQMIAEYEKEMGY